MANLFKETLEDLTFYNKTTDDVWWVGSRDGKFAISWKVFAKIADIEYDSGYGGQEIASDLVVVGDGWWLERHKYDGAENWSYKSTPILKSEALSFDKVKDNDSIWPTLDEINSNGTPVKMKAEAYEIKKAGEKPSVGMPTVIVEVLTSSRKFKVIDDDL